MDSATLVVWEMKIHSSAVNHVSCALDVPSDIRVVSDAGTLCSVPDRY